MNSGGNRFRGGFGPNRRRFSAFRRSSTVTKPIVRINFPSDGVLLKDIELRPTIESVFQKMIVKSGAVLTKGVFHELDQARERSPTAECWTTARLDRPANRASFFRLIPEADGQVRLTCLTSTGVTLDPGINDIGIALKMGKPIYIKTLSLDFLPERFESTQFFDRMGPIYDAITNLLGPFYDFEGSHAPKRGGNAAENQKRLAAPKAVQPSDGFDHIFYGREDSVPGTLRVRSYVLAPRRLRKHAPDPYHKIRLSFDSTPTDPDTRPPWPVKVRRGGEHDDLRFKGLPEIRLLDAHDIPQLGEHQIAVRMNEWAAGMLFSLNAELANRLGEEQARWEIIPDMHHHPKLENWY